MPYKAWLKVQDDGTIESVYWGMRQPPEGHTVEASSDEYGPELRRSGGQNLYYDQASATVCRRTPVRWVGRPTVVAVGDTIKLQLAGLPDGYRKPVSLQVGQDRLKLKHPYSLTLGWENPARVAVQIVDEPTLVQPELLIVQFVERRQRP